jgi:hypothetical protein
MGLLLSLWSLVKYNDSVHHGKNSLSLKRPTVKGGISADGLKLTGIDCPNPVRINDGDIRR